MPIMLITAATFAIITTIVLSLGRAMTAQSPVTQRVRELVGASGRLAPKARKRSGLISRLVTALGKGLGGDRSVSHRLVGGGVPGPERDCALPRNPYAPERRTGAPDARAGGVVGQAARPRAHASRARLARGAYAREPVAQAPWSRPRAPASPGRSPTRLDLMVVCLEAGLGLNATIAEGRRGAFGDRRRSRKRVRPGGVRAAQRAAPRRRAPRARCSQRHRRPEGARRPRHPERQARRQHGEDAADARRPAADEAPPARRGGGPQAAHQGAVPARALHSPGAVRRSRWAQRC